MRGGFLDRCIGYASFSVLDSPRASLRRQGQIVVSRRQESALPPGAGTLPAPSDPRRNAATTVLPGCASSAAAGIDPNAGTEPPHQDSLRKIDGRGWGSVLGPATATYAARGSIYRRPSAPTNATMARVTVTWASAEATMWPAMHRPWSAPATSHVDTPSLAAVPACQDSSAVALGRQALFIGGASGVPDEQRA